MSDKTTATVIWTWKEGRKAYTLEVPAEVDRCPVCQRGSGIIGVSLPREVPKLATDIRYQGKIVGTLYGKPYTEHTFIMEWG